MINLKMTTKEIKEKSNHYSVNEKLNFLDMLTSNMAIMNRSLWSDESYSKDEQITALKWSNELLHRIHNQRFQLKNYVSEVTISEVIENIEFYAKQSSILASHLSATLRTSWTAFSNKGIKRELEIDIDKNKRFLVIYCKLDKCEISLLTQNKNQIQLTENHHRIGIDCSYANIELPKKYDIIFDLENVDNYSETQTIIHNARNSGRWHWDLYLGHHSECIIEILGKTPKHFEDVEFLERGKTHYYRVGICNKENWEIIKRWKTNHNTR